MAPKRTTRSTPVTPTPNATPTTTVTEAQLQALIDQDLLLSNGLIAEASRVRWLQHHWQSDLHALTWWNAHVKTTTPEAAHAMSWVALKKMMTDKYCPRGCSLKNRTKLKSISVACRYDTWQCKASKPKTMQEAIEFTTELMDEKTHAYAKRQAKKKRKYDDLSKNN
ncbi:hypothetical protein Tco_1167031 [Tanacetum coccineum]